MPTQDTLSSQELWKTRAVKAARVAKRGALAAVKQADALIRVARQKAETMARRRKMRQVLRRTSRVLKTAGKAALAAGAVAALASVASEIRSRKRLRTGR